MAVPRYQNSRPGTAVDFIGPEGSTLGSVYPGAISGRLAAELSDEELLRQLSNAEAAKANYGFPDPAAAERYSDLMQERRNRESQKSAVQNSEIDKIFGPGSGGPAVGAPATGVPSVGGGSTPVFDQDAYGRDINQIAQNQRSALDNVFAARQKTGVQALNDIFGQNRGRAIEEEAALGRLRSPASADAASPIGQVDRSRDAALVKFITDLSAERGQAGANLENTLAGVLSSGRQFGAEANLKQQGLGLQGQDIGLREKLGRAGLLQGGQQFGQTLGLEERKFGEGQRKNAVDELFNRDSLSLAERLGKERAKAEEPGLFGQIANVAGGVGQLLGGIGAVKGVKK